MTGPRLVLNFGHTQAHALESSMMLGEIRNGEAVAIGMKPPFLFREKYVDLKRLNIKGLWQSLKGSLSLTSVLIRTWNGF